MAHLYKIVPGLYVNQYNRPVFSLGIYDKVIPDISEITKPDYYFLTQEQLYTKIMEVLDEFGLWYIPKMRKGIEVFNTLRNPLRRHTYFTITIDKYQSTFNTREEREEYVTNFIKDIRDKCENISRVSE